MRRSWRRVKHNGGLRLQVLVVERHSFLLKAASAVVGVVVIVGGVDCDE